MRDEDLNEELQTHLQIEIDERMQDGLSRADAEASARRAFGNVTLVTEVTREMWGGRSLERFAQDLRYSLRLLRRNPGFAAAVVLSIALGVGAESAVFSVANAVLLRPLSFAHPERLFAIAERPQEGAQAIPTMSGPDFTDFHDQNRSFEHLGAYLAFTFPLTNADEPTLLRAVGVSADFFDTLGLKPLIGRTYEPEQYRDDSGGIIISEGFWTRQFGRDPHVLGTIIYLNHAAEEIIGVMPQTADVFTTVDIWAKYGQKYEWARQRDNRFLSVVGLVRPGVSAARAREDLQSIYRRIAAVDPHATIDVTPLKEQLVGGMRNALLALLGAVGLVLLIACANVANLLLARGAAREREIATRYALGASRMRMIRQFVTESLLMTIIGGAGGLLLATLLIRGLVILNPDLPRDAAITIDARVLLFALAISLVAGVIFSVAPVVAASRHAVHDSLRTRTAGNPRERRTRGMLVAAELGIAVVLLAGAGLLGRSLWRVVNVMPGFRADHVLTMRLRVPDERIETPFYPRLLERLATRPGIQTAAVSDCMPTGFLSTADLLVPGRPSDPLRVPSADACFISGDYFRVLNIPLRAGRFFTAADSERTSPIVAISESVARQLWPGESALGRQLAVNYRSLGRATDDRPVTRTVVAIVGDVRQHGLEAPPTMTVYLPYQQDTTRRSLRAMVLFARTASPPEVLARTVQQDVRALAPDVPVRTISSLEAAIRETLAPRTFSLALFACFAGFALLLAGIGLYGVVSYAVTRRSREIGIRMALGARTLDVIAVVVGQESRWIAIGLVAGTAGAFVAARLLQGMLFEIGPGDARTFGGVAVLLTFVASVACWNPVRRAMRVDPVSALRAE